MSDTPGLRPVPMYEAEKTKKQSEELQQKTDEQALVVIDQAVKFCVGNNITDAAKLTEVCEALWLWHRSDSPVTGFPWPVPNWIEQYESFPDQQ